MDTKPSVEVHAWVDISLKTSLLKLVESLFESSFQMEEEKFARLQADMLCK